MSGDAAVDACARAVLRDGFCFVEGSTARSWLAAHGSLADWHAFARSWNDLGPDDYLAARGRQRRRRYGVWSGGADGSLRREPHQPHFQALAYNALQGDIERWFEPVADEVATGASMQAILRFAVVFFGALAPHVHRWHLEVHQFRIEASAGVAGEPTPEGVHRDGVDYVLVMMVERQNIASGTTTIQTSHGQPLGSFTLTAPFDAALLDDARVHHGVTPVLPLDAAQPAHRDVLVVTLRREV